MLMFAVGYHVPHQVEGKFGKRGYTNLFRKLFQVGDNLFVAIVEAQVEVMQIAAFRHFSDDGVDGAFGCPEVLIQKNHRTSVTV